MKNSFYKEIRELLYYNSNSIGRNDVCFCRSGKKFKKCCEKYVLKVDSYKSIVTFLNNAKVFSVNTDDIIGLSFSLDNINLPFSPMFIEFDKEVFIKDKDGIKDIGIVAVLIKESKGNIDDISEEFRKYSSLNGINIDENEYKKAGDVIEKVIKSEFEVILFDREKNATHLFFSVDIDDIGNVLGVDISDYLTPDEHIKQCNCFESNFSKKLNFQKVAIAPDLLHDVMKESAPEDWGLNKLPFCVLYNRYKPVAFMIYSVIAAINEVGTEYIDGEKLIDYNFNGESPTVMTVKLKNRIQKRYESTGLGTKHRYRYDVRGHFAKRHTINGEKIIWIEQYQRGNGEYLKKDYLYNGNKICQAKIMTYMFKIKKALNYLWEKVKNMNQN